MSKKETTGRKPGFNAEEGTKGFLPAPPVKAIAPTTNPVDKGLVAMSLQDVLDSVSYSKQYEKLSLKQDPIKLKTMEELTSYIVDDMSWLPEENRIKSWMWTRENIEYFVDRWSVLETDDWESDYPYEAISSPDPAFRYEENLNIATTEEKRNALRKLGYEHYLAQPLPVFVFGTLRPGQKNFGVIRQDGAIESINEGRVDGVVLLADKKFNVPQSTETEDESSFIIGDVIALKKDSNGEATRRSLDRLEGFSADSPSDMSSYRRVDKIVHTKNAEGEEQLTKAWVYISVLLEPANPERIFAEGDWLKHSSSQSSLYLRDHDLDPENWAASPEGSERL